MEKYTLKLTASDINEIINIIDVEIDWCFEKNQKSLGEATLKMRNRITDQLDFDYHVFGIKRYQIPKRILKLLNQPKKGM